MAGNGKNKREFLWPATLGTLTLTAGGIGSVHADGAPFNVFLMESTPAFLVFGVACLLVLAVVSAGYATARLKHGEARRSDAVTSLVVCALCAVASAGHLIWLIRLLGRS